MTLKMLDGGVTGCILCQNQDPDPVLYNNTVCWLYGKLDKICIKHAKFYSDWYNLQQSVATKYSAVVHTDKLFSCERTVLCVVPLK